ncbi:hypothetical protein PEC301645_24330 [Pectobacterium carotovorum subsp. carotovorum]|nr:hypothetical protein PEC301645_24330 [Pectobacterium carotovorum subsp. carotovorum]
MDKDSQMTVKMGRAIRKDDSDYGLIQSRMRYQ